MGFYRLIYRIGRMIFRDFLFKIPKKYLVVIIVFLTLFIIKTNVFAYSNYDTIPTDSPAVDCIFYEDSYIYYNRPYDLHLEQNISYNSQGLDGRYTFYFEIKPRSLTSQYDLLSYPNDNFRLYYQYGGGYAGFRLNLGGNTFNLADINDFDITEDITIQIVLTELNSVSIITQGDVTRQVALNFGSLYFNEDGLSDLILAGVGTSPYIKNVWIYTANIGSDYYGDLCNIYPCKYLDTSTGVLQYIPGSFDIVSGLFVYFDQWRYEENTLMDEPPPAIQNYTPSTPTPTPTPEFIDYTSSIDNVNNSINNLNDSITNDNISNSIIQVPTMPTDTSGVENGVNNIFTTIMNAYTNFNANQDIVFPIPFTNKNITINGNYTKNMLESVNATWIINIITAFWWYVISVYIVKDILKMVDKIQEGKIDNIENSNIKGDML